MNPVFFKALFMCVLFGTIQAQTEPSFAILRAKESAKQNQIQERKDLTWWVEVEDQYLVKAPQAVLSELEIDFEVQYLTQIRDESQLSFYQLDPHDKQLPNQAQLLLKGGRNAILYFAQPQVGAISDPHLFPFQANTVLAHRYQSHARSANRAAVNPVFEFFANQVNSQRWRADVERLAAINRWTRGPHILEARDWLVQQFSELHGITVTTESFPVGPDTGYNVIAKLTGQQKPDDWYIVGAHYDSISEDSAISAPGAEDNASGTAAVLEMARIFSENPPAATVYFICYSGEEQHLYGSTAHAQALVSNGDSAKFKGALIMDMIAYSQDSDLDCLLETGEIARFMTERFLQHAADYTNLRMVTSYNPFGSDHIPYLQRGLPALLVIENDYQDYPHYHRSTDLANDQNLRNTQAADILRMNMAAMADFLDADLNFFLKYWPNAPEDNPVPDFTGNQKLDVGEIILSLNRIKGIN